MPLPGRRELRLLSAALDLESDMRQTHGRLTSLVNSNGGGIDQRQRVGLYITLAELEVQRTTFERITTEIEAIIFGLEDSPLSPFSDKKDEPFKTQQAVELAVPSSRLRKRDDGPSDADSDDQPCPPRKRRELHVAREADPFPQEHEHCRGVQFVLEQVDPVPHVATDVSELAYPTLQGVFEDALGSAQTTCDLIHHACATEDSPTQLSPTPTEPDDYPVEKSCWRCPRCMKLVVTEDDNDDNDDHDDDKCPRCGIKPDVDLTTSLIKLCQDGKGTVLELPHTILNEIHDQSGEKQPKQRESEEAVTGIRTPHSTSREQSLPREACTNTTTAGAVIAEEEEVADTTSLVFRDPTEGTIYDPVKVKFDPIEDIACAMSTSITGEGPKLRNAPNSPVFHEPSDIKPFSCDECSSSFKRLDNLRRHSKIHKSESEESFFCDYIKCPRHSKPFGRKDHYRDHFRDYHKEDVMLRDKSDTLEWLNTCRVGLTWWRCSKCLSRTDINHGWKCSQCGNPCEDDRIKRRERGGANTIIAA